MNELIVTGVTAFLGYLGWCWVLPYKVCPSCKNTDKLRDSYGNYNRFVCWRCGGRDYPRIGTRLIGGNRRDNR